MRFHSSRAALGRFIAGLVLLSLAAVPATAQNRIQNGRFNGSIAGWTGGSGTQAAYNGADLNGASGSGSLGFINPAAGPFTFYGAFQCVNVTPGKYTFRAYYFFPSGQNRTGFTALRLVPLSGQNCTGVATSPALVSGNGTLIGGWAQVSMEPTLPPGTASASALLLITKNEAGGHLSALFDEVFLGQPCALSGTNLCVRGQRFGIRANWTTPQAASGSGAPIPITSEAGWFWFFSPSNPEVLIKVVNGCPINNRFWAFAGGLTDVKVDLTVTDYETGAVKTYGNPPGKAFQPIQDTQAFATCP